MLMPAQVLANRSADPRVQGPLQASAHAPGKRPAFRRTATKACIALAMAALPDLACGWSAPGHQSVGAIADHLIAGSRAAAQVDQILGGRSLQTVAVWADCARDVVNVDERTFEYREDLVQHPECVPFRSAVDKGRLESFVARNWKQCGTAHGSDVCHAQYHHADVSTRQDRYASGLVGTSDHDIVHAISAAVAVLRGRPSPAPIQIQDPQEALMLLAHFVGDLHMPLHVVALYLDADGRAIDPDKGGYPTASDTAEGGRLLDAGRSLHLEWDAIPSAFEVRGSEAPQLLQEAAALEPTPGDPDAWPIAWADQSILAGRRVAFAGLRFALRAPASGDAEAGQNYWDVSGADGGYWCSAEDLKYHQLARAGARLAQLLLAIWPDGNRRAAPVRAEAAADPMAGGGSGYLRPCQVAQLEAWLPPAPVPGSAALADDIARFRAERWILATARGQQAADDDVYDAPLVAARFGEAAGIALTPRQVPTLIKIIRRMQADAGRMVAPVKRPIRDGGRIRPFVAFPKAPSCLAPRDLAGHRQADLEHNHLDQGGSYPSSHALLGMLVGMVLGEALPARANALIERGLAFGDSRMICGFHYYSDVVAGRLVAASLFARLQAEEDFSDDMAALRVELGTAAAIEPVEFDRRPGR
jgi:hypothetical protein